MRNKKKKFRRTTLPPVFVFTKASLQVTQKAMVIFEQSFQRSKSLSDKIAFTEKVIESVNEKLHQMSTSVGLLCLMTFDYNEKIVIASAIKQYEIGILLQPLTPKNQQELVICQQVSQFALKDLGFQITLPTQD